MTEILEGKRRRRGELASLSYPEKVRIVERLREISIRNRQIGQQLLRSEPSGK